MNPRSSESPPGETFRETLRGAAVRRVMVPRTKLIHVPPDITLRELVDEYVLPRGYRGFPVVEGDRVVGVVSTEDFRRIPREDWPRLQVREIMVPIREDVCVEPDDSLDEALGKLAWGDRSRLLVVKNEDLQGLVTRGTIFRFLELEHLA